MPGRFSLFQRQRRNDGRCHHSGRQDDRVGLDDLIGQVHLVGLDLLYRGVGADVHARSRLEDMLCIVGGGRLEFGQDSLGGVQEMEADLLAADVGVVLHDLVHERRQFAEDLHADQAAAHDDEGQLPLSPRGVGFGISAFEPLDDVVAQRDRVGECLEAEGRFGAGDLPAVGGGSEGEDEVVVGQLIAGAFGGGADDALLEVDLADHGFDEAGALEEFADGNGAVAQFKGA